MNKEGEQLNDRGHMCTCVYPVQYYNDAKMKTYIHMYICIGFSVCVHAHVCVLVHVCLTYDIRVLKRLCLIPLHSVR